MFFCSFNGFKIEDILVEGMSAADILEMYPEVRDDFEVALVAMTIDTSSLPSSVFGAKWLFWGDVFCCCNVIAIIYNATNNTH